MSSTAGERVGVCLDIDGTLYREGSAFVDVLVALPVTAAHPFGSSDRTQFRRAVGVVGRYEGGVTTAWCWRATLRAVEGLRRVTDARTAGRALDGLKRLQAWLADRRASGRSRGDYETMQKELLEQYGTAIAGHDRTTIQSAVAACLQDLDPVDPETVGVLREATRAGIDVALVTDMPAHVAEQLATAVIDAPVRAVVGTRFGTDRNGRFTGAFEPVDKGIAVSDLREKHGWASVVAAGDTRRDLAMAETADRFLAVAGQGRIRAALADPPRLDAEMAGRSGVRDPPVASVPPDQSLGAALRVALGLG